MYCSVMFGGFNTREGVRWFLWVTKIIWIFCFNTRVGVRWFRGNGYVLFGNVWGFQYPCGCEVVPPAKTVAGVKRQFQYPCGCEVVPKAVRNAIQEESFNTRVGVRWFIKNKQSKFFIILIIIHYLQKFIQLNTEPKWFYTEQYKNVDYLSANL